MVAAEFSLLLDELRAWLGLGTSADEQRFDSVLMRCIEAAERRVARHCGRGTGTWLTAARTEYFSGTFNAEMILTYTPVTALASVAEVTSATTAGVETTSTGGLEVNRFTVDGYAPGAAFTAHEGILRFRGNTTTTAGNAFESGGEILTLPRYHASPNFGDGAKSIKVAYTGGFASVGVTPGDLLQAFLECAAELAVDSPKFADRREQVVKGRWKELAAPFVRGGVL